MRKIIVIYESKYGSTRCYAQWIAEELTCSLFERKDFNPKDFTKYDQERLAYSLKKTLAKFVLVIKNTEFISSLYEKDFNILSFDKQYTYNVKSRNNRDVEHLIITNLPV